MSPALRSVTLAAAAVAACGSPAPKPAPAPAPAVAAPTPTPASVAIDAHEEYYDVYGSSTAELREQIRRLGPKEGNESTDALTVWDLESSYGEAPGPGGCGLRNVQVTLTVTVTLPRWTPPGDAAPQLIASWRTYLQHVRTHEAGHRAIAEQNARELMAALSGLRAATCPAVWDQASRTVERIVAEGRVRNRAYDDQTKHGQTQGVVLAP